MKKVFGVIVVLFITNYAHAVNYYISPGGFNGNSGLSEAEPKQTFGHTLPLLNAGDTLLLMNGTYTVATNGGFFAGCTGSAFPTGASDGTVGNEITVKAVNERQAVMQGNGTNVVWLHGCDYLVI